MALRPLMTHQQEALAWAESRDAIALFMEMRLGKSAVAIRWAQQRAPQGRVLIVAPKPTLYGWRDELKLEGVPSSRIRMLAGLSPVHREIAAADPQASWFLVNYELVRQWPALATLPWRVLVLDESTRIRNPQAQITKVLTRKYDDVPFKALLTGLPNPESPMDYYTQMAFLNDGRFMGHSNFWTWRDRFFFQIGYDWHPRRKRPGFDGTRALIKKEVQRLAFVKTRRQANVGSVLLHETRTVPMNPAQQRAWRDIAKHFRYGELETKSAGAQFAWLQRVAGGFSPDREHPLQIATAKMDELHTLLQTELKGEPVVVWFHFNEELAATYHFLKERGYTVTAVLGATPHTLRYARQRRFQRGQVQIFCIQEEIGKFGLDLSVADTEIYYSNSWAYETRAQSQDRIVHARKTHPLLAIDLVTEGTTDEDVVSVLQDKSVDAKSFTSALLSKVRERFHGKTTQVA